MSDLDFDRLMRLSVRFGLTPSEFWDLTPAETMLLIEERSEEARTTVIQTAWLTARLSRTKRVPTLSRLLASRRARQVSEQELRDRREEFERLKGRFDATRLVRRIKEGTDD